LTQAGKARILLGVPREREKVVFTLVVMRPFSVLQGAPRACGDFGDPTAVSRLQKRLEVLSIVGNVDRFSGGFLVLIPLLCKERLGEVESEQPREALGNAAFKGHEESTSPSPPLTKEGSENPQKQTRLRVRHLTTFRFQSL